MTRNRILLALLAVALLAAVLVVLREQAGPPPPEPPGPTAIAEQPRPTILETADFADERHWFGLRAQCREPNRDRCVRTLVTVEDGAPRVRELPEELRGDQEHQRLTLLALGPRQVAVRNRYFRSWYSGDAGQSWAEVHERAAPVDRIPPAAVLERDCSLSGCEQRIVVVLPESGRPAELRGLPPLTDPHPVPIPDGQGHWRVVGTLAGKPVVATSADHGNSWQTSALPPGGPTEIERVQLIPAGDRGYLQVDGKPPPGGDTSTGLYRGEGADWRLVWRSTPGEKPLSGMYGLVPAPGNRLVSLDHQRATGVSEDGGRTFRPARPEEELPGVWISHTRKGHLVTSFTDISHSPDGGTWTVLPKG
ncbi:beta propeller repeat protein [Crossiella cryophila]|uniref:Exo-alpha-sialidase n=1 Tax=Crossiella cryophila TaxID=43355 RepID=A0A7W7FZI7_9PSEU|nr:hypothetical protein [Crossiella cryophila]MBB4681234.1 hypothetical protein [Crossiella cryophila]